MTAAAMAHLLVLAIALFAEVAAAQEPLERASSNSELGPIELARVAVEPELEPFLSRDLDPEAVRGLTRVTGFAQREPRDGAAPSESTEVYLGFSESHFYAIFRAFDSEPQRLRAHLSRRDSLRGDDHVTLVLDTFGDKRRAYQFRSNPLGVQYDAVFTEGDRPDRDFDAVWRSQGRLTDWGYVVWMAIPFRSLRFAPAGSSDWGLVLMRERPREIEEELTWPWVSSSVAGFLDQAAILRGVTPSKRARKYQVIPYSSFRALSLLEEDDGGTARLASQPSELEIGADFKAVFRDRLVLDATLNPDFGQVESDEPQVTVNQRFEVFFPERRPFFLENADFFQTPINLVFTRRILEPSFGARVTGKLGNYGVGALITDDEGPGKLVAEGEGAGERAHVGIARLQRDVGEQSTVGLLYTQRDFAGEGNRVLSADGRFKLSPKWVGEFQLARSESDEPGAASTGGTAFSAEIDRSGRFYEMRSSLLSLDEDFDSDLGFIRRTDIRQAETSMSWLWRPDEGRLVRWGPELEVLHRTDRSGLWLDREAEISFDAEWQNETRVGLNYARAQERLRPGDVSGVDRLLELDTRQWTLELGSTPSSAFEIDFEVGTARSINFEPPEGEEPSLADEIGAELELTIRPLVSLRIDNTLLFTRLEDRQSEAKLFDDWIARTRWSWQVSLSFSVRVILQWEETSPDSRLTSVEPEETLNADVLLAYQFNPWTAIYLGYTENRASLFEDLGDGSLRRRRDPRVLDRLVRDAEQVFVKVSYLIW